VMVLLNSGLIDVFNVRKDYGTVRASF
jgi:hypothetical protein